MNWNEIAKNHHAWVDSMGWHKSTHLEVAGLVGSEIGEMAAEIDQAGLMLPGFSVELSDVLLRLLDQSYGKVEDFDKVLNAPRPLPEAYTAETAVLGLLKMWYPWLNTARKTEPGPEHIEGSKRLMAECAAIAKHFGFDIKAVVIRKMTENFTRGNKGREK